MKILLCTICILTVFISADAADSQPTLKQLSWIAGHWVGDLWGGRLEEVWTGPEGDCMIGMFRFVKDNKVQFYEFLTIEQESERLVLRLKHYNPGLKGWEEKDESIVFPLISIGANEAVFQRQEKDKASKMTFRLKDAETLIVILESVKEGKPVADEFIYKRK